MRVQGFTGYRRGAEGATPHSRESGYGLVGAMLGLAALMTGILYANASVRKGLESLGTSSSQYDNIVFSDIVTEQVSRRMESFLYWLANVKAWGYQNACPVAGALLYGVPPVDNYPPRGSLQVARTWFDDRGTAKVWNVPYRNTILALEMGNSSLVKAVFRDASGAEETLDFAYVNPFHNLATIPSPLLANVTNWRNTEASKAPMAVKAALDRCLGLAGAPVAGPGTAMTSSILEFCTYLQPNIESTVNRNMLASLGASALIGRLETTAPRHSPHDSTFFFAINTAQLVDSSSGEAVKCDKNTDFLAIPGRGLVLRSQFFQLTSGQGALSAVGSKTVERSLISSKLRREVVNCFDPRLNVDPAQKFVCLN